MTTPPGQEPRPGFTPRGGQARPGSRAGGSGWPDDDSRRRDEPRARRPNADGPGQVPDGIPGNGGTREPGRDAGDRWPGGGQPGQRPANGSRPPGGNPFRDRGYRGGPDRTGGADGRDPRGDPSGPRPEASPRAAPSFSPARSAAGTGATRGTGGSTASKRAPAEAPRSGLLATPALSWVGRLPEKGAVLVFAGIMALGTILTVVMGQDPGFLLGLFLILGSVAATAAVRRGAAHKFIPLPALAYLVAATVTGMAHDPESLNSTRQFLLDFLTWIGGAFVAVTASTILVVLIALSRWLLSGRLVSGQLPGGGAGSPRAAARPATRGPRGGRGSYNGRDDRSPRSSRDQRDDGSPGTSGPWRNQGRLDDRGPRAEGTWPSQTFRGNRDQRDDDTWGAPSSRDDRGRRDEGTWPSQGMREGRDTWGDRPSGGDPRDGHPRDKRHGRGPYVDRDPRDAPHSPNGPRDIW
jgi:hypothetical protein